MNINKERLAETFITLCETDSPSRQEAKIAALLKTIFADLGAEIIEDDSASKTGSDTNNLLVRFQGGLDLEPLLFSCHMDTVNPGTGVEVQFQNNRFTSKGSTILGADDKSAIAILIEAMRSLQEQNIAHGPVEFLFTTCEEIGLLGAKSFDTGMLQAKSGFALDTSGTDQVIIGAPAANRFVVEISGHAAHAGLAPEKGVNAIQLAAKAIAELDLGRLDKESTANIGRISGGTATNIIADYARVEGEIRSHSKEKLLAHTAAMEETFRQVVDDWTDPTGLASGNPSVTISVRAEYPLMKLDPTVPVLLRLKDAAARLGRNLEPVTAGGGSDANILNSCGISCAILGTGMTNVHTVNEYIDLDEMIKTGHLVISLITA